jgi:biofilm PGA synthesis protein PgaA
MRRRTVFLTCACLLSYALVIDPGGVFRGCTTAAIGAEPVAARPWGAEQSKAVLLARQGDTAAALAILQRLRNAHPDDLAISDDYIVVCTWAGHQAEAVQLFATLRPGPRPDYLIDAVARAYRTLGQSTEALALYRQGLHQSPDNPTFTAGEIRSMVDLHQLAPALAMAETDLRIHGERLDVLLAAGYAASVQKRPVEALRYIDRAAKLDPASHEARHDRILAIDEMGAPQVARQLAQESPGTISIVELRRIDGDAAAALVRWGVFEPPSEAQRFAASDRAIAALDGLIARWSREGDAAKHDVLRARFDRMVALRDRVRMADVLVEYENLQRQDVVVPGYALVAVADAYLYFRQPEKARDLSLRGLEVDPNNPETRLALFYAYVDLENFDAADREADSTAADQAIWIHLKGLHDPIENPERATADLASAHGRLYADELADADRRITAMADAAPNNTRYLSALAAVYSARGWPLLAAEEYDISRALKPLNVTAEVGQARNNLDLHAYRLVETEADDLTRRFPENLEVQRLDRLWEVHNMWEARLAVAPTWTSPTNIQGGSGIAIDGQIYSLPIDYNWRLFVDEHVANEQLPENEGTVTLRRSAAGIEYRGGDLVASLAATISVYGPNARSTLETAPDGGRGGLDAQVNWSLNDYWNVGGGAELFALDTPLRALGNGITANSATASVVYRESESRAFVLTGETMDFSDGNLRTSLDGRYTQRLLTLPHFTIDGIADLAESHNSANSDRPYFNPSQDALATLGLSINQIIYRRYQVIYEHHLTVTPGVYWQQNFGAGGAGSVLYEHRIRINDVFEAALGATVSRQQFDGQYQNTVAVLLSLRQRF